MGTPEIIAIIVVVLIVYQAPKLIGALGDAIRHLKAESPEDRDYD